MQDTLFESLSVGDKLYIELYIDKKRHKLPITVMELVSTNKIIVSCPIFNDHPIGLNIGERFRLELQNNEFGITQFVALVVNRDKPDAVIRLHMLRVSDVKKEQRREFFRLQLINDIVLKIQDGESVESFLHKGQVIEERVPNYKEIKALAKDVSAGGIKVICKEALPLGTELIVTFELEAKKYALEGVVLRSFRLNDVVERHELGIQFHNIDKATQNDLIAVIFDMQRKLLKKGWFNE